MVVDVRLRQQNLSEAARRALEKGAQGSRRHAVELVLGEVQNLHERDGLLLPVCISYGDGGGGGDWWL